MRAGPAAVLDVTSVLVFVTLGVGTHAGELAVTDLAATAWPFLAALVLGWVVARAWRTPAAVIPTGAPVWLVTAAGGLLLRRLAGEGTAFPFVVVAVVSLGLLLLGWRLIAGVAARRS